MVKYTSAGAWETIDENSLKKYLAKLNNVNAWSFGWTTSVEYGEDDMTFAEVLPVVLDKLGLEESDSKDIERLVLDNFLQILEEELSELDRELEYEYDPDYYDYDYE